MSALAEHKLPVGAVAVQANVTTDDSGDTWGPGVALVFPGGKLVRINLRGGSSQFGVDATGVAQKIAGSFQKKTDITLRIRCEADKIILETRNADDEEEWQSIAELPRTSFPGNPTAVRLGKSHGVESTDDNGDPGQKGTTRFGALKIYWR